jgi:formate hydrogenlyase subunit 6/NADH:ubiquinone oxidoreductase subunit I
MHTVSFGWARRLEMAVAWAFPVSAFVALVLFVLWRSALVPAVLLIWGLALLAFGAFPLYARWLGPQGNRPGSERVSTRRPFIVRRMGRDATATRSGRGLSFEQGGLQIILWGLCLLGLVGYAVLSGALTWGWLWRRGLLTLVLVILVTVDLTGMTPVYKSGMQEDRFFRVGFEVDLCVGDGACERVCPRNCFVVDSAQGKAAMPGRSRCVQCGACIVQCPGDALSFVSPSGEVVGPEAVRRYKLNMMGKRARRKE